MLVHRVLISSDFLVAAETVSVNDLGCKRERWVAPASVPRVPDAPRKAENPGTKTFSDQGQRNA